MPQSQPQLISYNTNDFFYMTAPMDTTDSSIGLSKLNTSGIGYSLPTYNQIYSNSAGSSSSVPTKPINQYFPGYSMPWITDNTGENCKTQCNSDTDCNGYIQNTDEFVIFNGIDWYSDNLANIPLTRYSDSLCKSCCASMATCGGYANTANGCYLKKTTMAASSSFTSNANITQAGVKIPQGCYLNTTVSASSYLYNITNIGLTGIISTKDTATSSYFDNDNTYLNDTNTLDYNQKHIATMRNSIDNGKNGYNKALLKNYDLAQQLQSIKNTSMSSDQMYDETKSLYSRELLMTINLVVGLIIAAIFIYFNR